VEVKRKRIMKHIALTVSLIAGTLTISYITVQAFVDRQGYEGTATVALYLILGSLWVIAGLILRELEQGRKRDTDEKR
jgi:hypothetical protein